MITTWLKYFSTTRFVANKIHQEIVNFLFDEETLTRIYVKTNELVAELLAKKIKRD